MRTIDAEGLHVCDLVPDTVGRHEVHPGYASSSRVRAEDAKLVTHTQWCRLTLPQNLVHAEEFTGLRLMGTDGDGPASPIQDSHTGTVHVPIWKGHPATARTVCTRLTVPNTTPEIVR